MLERAEDKVIFGGVMTVKTLLPEDIIGLKLQSVYNNPAREKIDMADIELLVSIRRDALDRQLLQRYFRLFEMEDLYKSMLKEDES